MATVFSARRPVSAPSRPVRKAANWLLRLVRAPRRRTAALHRDMLNDHMSRDLGLADGRDRLPRDPLRD